MGKTCRAERLLRAFNVQRKAISQRQVALLSYCSMGTQRNDKEILMWLQKATEQNWGLQASPSDWEIICNIALMYFNEWGTAQDFDKAFEYAKRAADADYARGYYLMAWYHDRKKNMSEAFKYYKKSAERGWLDGQYDVGCCYLFGDGCAVNYSKAHYWFFKAAEHNHAAAENNLGQMYLNSHGVRKDLNTAKKWFKRAIFW